jgi:thioredoxin reductase (NADPH)
MNEPQHMNEPKRNYDPKGMSPPVFDLAIIGAGPCGIAAGAAAVKAGLSAVLVDKGPLCDSIMRYPIQMQFFSTPEKLEIEGIPFASVDGKVTRAEALAYYRGVTAYFGLEVRMYEAVERIEADERIDGHEGAFLLNTVRNVGDGGPGVPSSIRARNVVVATGGFHGPNRLDALGASLPKVSHNYIEAHPYWNRDVIVVGGANSAVEAALELYRTGARVTLVHFGDGLDRGVKPWVRPDIENRLTRGEIGVRWGHRVAEVRAGEVVLRDENSGALETLPNDHVLALTGWKADPVLLRGIGVPVDPETGIPAHDPDTMETPVPGVFIAGVLAAGHNANRIFIENGRWHGGAIVRAIQNRKTGSPINPQP